MKTGNKLKDTQVYLTGNPKSYGVSRLVEISTLMTKALNSIGLNPCSHYTTVPLVTNPCAHELASPRRLCPCK
jgi:hypothetical protein